MAATFDSKIFNKKVSVLEQRILTHADDIAGAMRQFFGRNPKYIVFLSVCNTTERARVFVGVGNSVESGWRNAMIACRKFIKERNWQPIWMKADLVKEIETYTLEQFLAYSTKGRRNYLREGISFDPFFGMAFLEQEMNANGFIRRDDQTQQDNLHVSNINFYLKNFRSWKTELKAEHISKLYLFSTYSYFYDTECHELHNGPLHNGRRVIREMNKDTVYYCLDRASQYLAEQTRPNGKFNYGYFPAFHRTIGFYNMLRHASTVYSMIEAYELTRSKRLERSIRRALQFLVNEGIVYVQSKNSLPIAYVVESESGNEIKLGANAAAILALTKFTTVFQSDEYSDVMAALANGIVNMQNSTTGEFVHVLNYPDLTVKDQFRIIYYDGEAAFALMRLYAIDNNPLWLATVERVFSHFIKNDYWKHHDHWLSYCTNELTEYKPLDRYYEFGLKNVKNKLDFILERDTTYPTFLELLMAARKMIAKMKLEHRNDLLKDFPQLKLIEAIEHRVKHQLNGFFFPEAAMYFKSPETIVGAFYIRHHSFRCRIDDVEHNISGYVHYYKDITSE